MAKTPTVIPPLTKQEKVRFWTKVERPTLFTCWQWQAGKDAKGYGRFNLRRLGHTFLSHRLAWGITRGPIPEGLWVCHKCDNASCCNPAHLFLGTPRDNNRDCLKKNRNRAGAPKGIRNGRAKLSEADVYAIRSEYRNGQGSHAMLGRKYGVTPTAIEYIVQRKTWKHLN